VCSSFDKLRISEQVSKAHGERVVTTPDSYPLIDLR
jgi:hypothetical protein